MHHGSNSIDQIFIRSPLPLQNEIAIALDCELFTDGCRNCKLISVRKGENAN